MTTTQQTRAREFERLGPGFVSPEWADDVGFEAAVEHRADQIMDDDGQALEPLMQDAIEHPMIREALVSIFQAIEGHRCGRLSTDQARSRVWTAASCLFDAVRDDALAMAQEELSR